MKAIQTWDARDSWEPSTKAHGDNRDWENQRHIQRQAAEQHSPPHELLQSIRAKGNVDTGFATQRRDNLVLPSPELLQSTCLSTTAAADQTASIDSELRHGADA